MSAYLTDSALAKSVNAYMRRRRGSPYVVGTRLEPRADEIRQEVADAEDELKLREFERVMAGEKTQARELKFIRVLEGET